MNFNPKKLFVIVGYPHIGKTKTLQQIFQRRLFFPFKQPIHAPSLGDAPFIVVNNSDTNHRSEDQLARIRSALHFHTETDTSFLIPASLVFDDGIRDIKGILAYLNRSGLDVHYLVLRNSWFDKRVISDDDLLLLKKYVESGTIHILDRLVTQSKLRFDERVKEMEALMRTVLESRVRYCE
ncbi:hypothetical protein HGH93_17175 [Chitinophaga polysaccharea]|uniref:hypothetical protein n=1 Tax=Chitinophaga polysaccharea TaxID=1293035 RepID=UPI001455C39B|nr:hypothetical protein [Chitinophaga polysaccharea]NLR59845.1 hypothetical protein [Chitinophaga polysaccharea]